MLKLLKNIFTFPVPLTDSPLKWINSYIIKGENRSLLIDTAFNREECYNSIKNGFSELNLENDKTDIFLTHMHTDHAGLVARLKTKNNIAFASKKDGETVNSLNQPEHWKMIEMSVRLTGTPPQHSIDYKNHVAFLNRPDTKVNFTFLKEGDSLNYGGYNFKVLSLEGHTPAQIGLYCDEHGILFCGDHILDRITPHITCWDLENDYLGEYLQNLKKVSRLNLKHVFTAHREIPQNPSERIKFLLNHHDGRLQEVIKILEKGEKTAFQTAEFMTWSVKHGFWEFPVTQKWFAASEALAHLQHLWFLGEVSREMGKNGECIFSVK